jgi:hypothetical protein
VRGRGRGRSYGRAEMSFQIRSFNTGLAMISLASSLSLDSVFVFAWHPYCVISNSIITIVIHTTQHHYQSLTTPNDVTIRFATKCSIIISFNCHTLDLSFFSPPLRFRHSPPLYLRRIKRSRIGSFCNVSRPSYMRVIFQTDA